MILRRNLWDVENAECLDMCVTAFTSFQNFSFKVFSAREIFLTNENKSSSFCNTSLILFTLGISLKNDYEDLSRYYRNTVVENVILLRLKNAFYEVLSEVTKICDTFANEEKLF